MFNIRSILLFTLASAVVLPSAFAQFEPRCANNPPENKVAEMEAHFAKNRVFTNLAAERQDAIDINVYFNIVVDEDANQTGSLSTDTINAQINTLNAAYRPANITFNLKQIFRAVNTSWFNNAGPVGQQNLAVNRLMKQELRTGGAGDLNIYSVGMTASGINKLLGWGTFPQYYQGDPVSDGVLVKYTTLPGVDTGRYNLGMTLVHEVGHWMGLYHVFQNNDCVGNGDFVADTPPQSLATSGCPANKDSCLGGGLDSIHNYMDYSDDACMNMFTAGQITRLKDQIATYRNLM